VPPRPFLRPAYESKKSQAVDVIVKELKKRIFQKLPKG
jgi:hypothetical protein